MEVIRPVVEPVDERLTRDCAPMCAGRECQYRDPQTLTISEIIERLEAVEDALAICRNDKALIREAQRRAQ